MRRWLLWSWTQFKIARQWLIKPTRLIGIMLFVIGLPGLLENIHAWHGWLYSSFHFLGSVSFDKYFGWASYPGVYWGLFSVGTICFLYAERIGEVLHSLRRRIDYMVAIQAGKENFISESDALSVVMNSQWGRARRRRNEKPRSLLDTFSYMQTDPARDVRGEMFAQWCRLALSRFETEEADSVRTNNGRKEYDEVSSRAWLSAKYHEDIIEEFGPI